MLNQTRMLFLALMCSLVFTGCGGGSHTQIADSTSKKSVGSIRMTVHWPHLTRLVPIATQSINVVLTANGQQVGQQLVPRPAEGTDLSSIIFASLPSVDVTVQATALPSTDGTGNALASGTMVVTVQSGTVTNASLTMNSTIASVIVTPVVHTSIVGSVTQVAASAIDSNGSTVLTADSKWQWLSSDPSVITVVSNGSQATLQARSVGSADISAVEMETGFMTRVSIGVQNGFSYPDFASVSGLTLNGQAAAIGPFIRVAPLGSFTVGSFWRSDPQMVSTGFDTTFQFRISSPDTQKADGLAFLIQNSGSNVLGSAGEGVGYGGTFAPGIADSLAIEFDVYHNSNQGDPNDNHISIHTRGSDHNNENEAFSLGSTTNVPNLTDGNIHTSRIVYTTHRLQVYVDDLMRPLLDIPYTFENGGTYLNGQAAPGLQLANGTAWVGFTSATGTRQANHDVLNWAFSTH